MALRKLQLSPERVHLLQKVAKKDKDPIEIIGCTLWTVFLFLWVYCFTQSKMRYEDWKIAYLLGPILGFILCTAGSFHAYQKMKVARVSEQVSGQFERRNLYVNLAVCSWLALIAGCFLGDHSYWTYTTNIYSYRDLVSYVDIDPYADKGSAFMDAGHVYFKEHTYVQRFMWNKFKNADEYCVAPIVRGAVSPTNKVVPLSDGYDWWAVGTNCCGDQANQRVLTEEQKASTVPNYTPGNFTCGEVNYPIARSGMRLLSDTQRPYYLLAVQEWSATYGLPVKHPLFFTWVKDPLETEDQTDFDSVAAMWNYVWYITIFAFILSFILHMVMHRNKIY